MPNRSVNHISLVKPKVALEQMFKGRLVMMNHKNAQFKQTEKKLVKKIIITKMFNKQTNIFLVCIDYFSKCKMGSERGADNDMFCTFHTSRCYDLAPDENWCFKAGCAHTVPCLFCETEVYVQHMRGICVCVSY